MQKTLITCLLLVCASPIFAGNLCDAQCSVFIDFPDGGSLIATEELTITFGDNSLMEAFNTTVANVEGDTLTLNTGEYINFTAGGSFYIGDAGNINYSNLEIVTTGAIDIVAMGGTETINISVLIVTGAATLTLQAKEIVFGELDMEEGSLEVLAPGEESESCSIEAEEGIVLSGDDVVINTSQSCDLVLGDLSDIDIAGDFDILTPVDVGKSVIGGGEQPEVETSNDGALSLNHFLALLLFLPVYLVRRQLLL